MQQVPKWASSVVKGIQGQLNFNRWCNYPQFKSNTVCMERNIEMYCFVNMGIVIWKLKSAMRGLTHEIFTYISNLIQGLGRTAWIGTILGIVWGIHFVIGIQLLLYLCFFHSINNNNELQIHYDSISNTSNATTTATHNNTQRQQNLFMLLQRCTEP